MAINLSTAAAAGSNKDEVYQRNQEARPGEEIPAVIASSFDHLQASLASPKIMFKGRVVSVKFTLSNKRHKQFDSLPQKPNKVSVSFNSLPPNIIRAICDFFLPSYPLVSKDFNAKMAVQIPDFRKSDSFHRALTKGKIEKTPKYLAVWLRMPSITRPETSSRKIDHLPGFDPVAVVPLALVCRRWNHVFRLDLNLNLHQFINKTILAFRWKIFFNCLIKRSVEPKRLKQIFYQVLKSGRSPLVNDFLLLLAHFSNLKTIVYLFSQLDKFSSALSHLLKDPFKDRKVTSFHEGEKINFLFAFIVKHRLYLNPLVFDPQIFYQDYKNEEYRKDLPPLLKAIYFESDKKAKEFFLNFLVQPDPNLHNIVYHAVLYHDYNYLEALCTYFPKVVIALVNQKDVREMIRGEETPQYYVEMDQCYTLLYRTKALRTDLNPTFQSFIDGDRLPLLKDAMPKESQRPGGSAFRPARVPHHRVEVNNDSNTESHGPIAKKPSLDAQGKATPAASPLAPPPATASMVRLQSPAAPPATASPLAAGTAIAVRTAAATFAIPIPRRPRMAAAPAAPGFAAPSPAASAAALSARASAAIAAPSVAAASAIAPFAFAPGFSIPPAVALLVPPIPPSGIASLFPYVPHN